MKNMTGGKQCFKKEVMSKMWWMFEKKSESETHFIYTYSRESYDLDGIIQINKNDGTSSILNPCSADGTNRFASRKAIEKAYTIFSRGFPQSEQIACA